MMDKVSFFTPVDYGSHPKTLFQCCLEKIDAYFYLGGRKVRVIPGVMEKNSQGVEWVSGRSSMLATLVKIASYFTIILPLIMLAAKAVLRSGQDFHISQKGKGSGNSEKQIPSNNQPFCLPLKTPPPDNSKINEPPPPYESDPVAKIEKNPVAVPSDISLDLPLSPARAAPPAKTLISLTEMHSHIEKALEHLRELSSKLKKDLAIDGDGGKDITDTIMQAKQGLRFPPERPINNQNLWQWKSVIDKISKEIHSLYNSYQEAAKAGIVPLEPDEAINTILSGITSELDAVIPCIAEGYYLCGERDTAGSVIKQVVHNSQVKDKFFIRGANDHYNEGKRKIAVKWIKEVIHDSDTREKFFIKVADDYYQENDCEMASEVIKEVIHDSAAKEAFLKKLSDLPQGKPNAMKPSVEQANKDMPPSVPLTPACPDINNGMLKEDKLSDKILPLIVHKQYDQALKLLEKNISVEAQRLRKLVEMHRKCDEAIKLIENASIPEGVSIIQGLESCYKKDDIIIAAIKHLVGRGYYKEGVILLNEPFYSTYKKGDALKAFAEALGLSSSVLEDSNRANIAKFLFQKKEYAPAAKMAHSIENDTYDKRELLRQLSTYSISL